MRLLTSSRSSRYLVLLSLVLAFSSSAAFAQGSGTLTGRIQDSKTGESLAGANIVVVHTPIGNRG